MKILYLSNTTTKVWPRKHENFPSTDYLSDCLLHGLKSIYSSDVVDIPYKPCMYKSSNVNKLDLYGRGFTLSKTLEDDDSDRTQIEEKIKSKFYDCIIYGSIHRNRHYFDLVTQIYDRDKIIILDGEDNTEIDFSLVDMGIYFKRELLNDDKNIFPISFAFPKEKIQKANKNKVNMISETLPSQGTDTFIWNDEQDYYNSYNKSYFGNTWKKGGWDCLRHYEIIFSYCYPRFTGLDECPPRCLTTLPKNDIIETVNKCYNGFLSNFYYDQMDKLFEYAKENLTTEALAKYVLGKIS